ncbi:MAG: hypothetical protein OQK51_22475 [Kangiellaceae bacterium]|nr:hypothetical protein [Kangiellaceae bacterium]
MDKLLLIILSMVFLFSCADKAKNSSEEEAKSKAEKAEVTVVEKEDKSIRSSSSIPKSSKPISDLKPVDESEKNSEVKIVPNQYPLEHIQKEKEKEKEKKKSSDEKKSEDDTKP